MILLTGAGGKTGRAVCRALAAGNAPVRALVHHPEHVALLRELGAVDAMVGDLRAPRDVGRALAGVRVVYHICPNVHPDEIEIGRLVIEAARRADVGHLVYHSVLHPQTEEMPHHWQKLRVEEELFRLGVPFTILQPSTYMQNILAGWDSITREGIHRVPYALETRLGMVDLADVAAAAKIVLMTPGHEGAIYELAPQGSVTPLDVAAALSDRLARPIRAEVMPRLLWVHEARLRGMGEYQIRTLLQMFEYYERYGFWGNPNCLTRLLGRPPATLAMFLERVPVSPHHPDA